jgi:hypothetical protein
MEVSQLRESCSGCFKPSEGAAVTSCTKRVAETLRRAEKVLKNGVFWDVTPCGSCKNRRFGGTQRLLHQDDNNRSTS